MSNCIVISINDLSRRLKYNLLYKNKIKKYFILILKLLNSVVYITAADNAVVVVLLFRLDGHGIFPDQNRFFEDCIRKLYYDVTNFTTNIALDI